MAPARVADPRRLARGIGRKPFRDAQRRLSGKRPPLSGEPRPGNEAMGGAPQYAASVRIAAVIFAGESMKASSSGRAFGEAGESGPARRLTGPSR